MRNEECTAFLQWCLPRLDLRWAGFRKVRGTVCKRVGRRIRALGLTDAAAYRAYLESHAEEWPRLDAMCRIPISRFWRDRAVFDCLARTVLPRLAADAAERPDGIVRAWSAGSASGEEPYSLALAWSRDAALALPSARLEIVATEIDDVMLRRSAAGLYPYGSFRDLPRGLLEAGFRRSDDIFQIREPFRRAVTFVKQDIRTDMPDGPFDLILCRNLVFTYFGPGLQAVLFERMRARLRPGGAFVIGAHERLPEGGHGLQRWDGPEEIFRYAPEG